MSDSRPDRWIAPWTDEQVAALNALQDDPRFHGYTCPGDHCCTGLTRMLVATADGWVCDCGNYSQGWAHALAARPTSPAAEAGRG